jgi:hypothetical protein
MKKRVEFAVVLGFALSLSCSALAGPPSQPFLFGAYTGPNVSLQQFETEINHTIAIDDHFQTFYELPKQAVAEDIEAGIMPMIVWDSDDNNGGSVLATDILAGKYDAQIAAEADSIAALGVPVILEWEPEMTGAQRMPLFFANVTQTQWGPTYVAVWLYMRNIFAQQGATNVQWAWSPGAGAYTTEWRGKIKCQPYFPGPQYVDWMGLHVYNKTKTPEPYDTDNDVVSFYAMAQQWAPGKPLISSQTGASNYGELAPEWISTAESGLKTEYPLIRGFVWFNSGTYTLKGDGLAAFAAMAADPNYQ